MLTLILGRAGTGKTTFALNDIREKMDAGESNLLLIVPEQYSHDAEKQLCGVCGDTLSMHGETLSFKRLCARVISETGGLPEHILDAGGQIIIMYRAIESVAHLLKTFNIKGLWPEQLERILDAVNEFKSLRLLPSKLERIAEQTSNPLRDKLFDLIHIYNSYDALARNNGNDAADMMTLLAEMIGDSTIASSGRVYFDGFNDFTAQELRVIEELLLKNAEITVCLTCDLSDDSEVFELPRKTVGQIRRLAEECGVEVRIVNPGAPTIPVAIPSIDNNSSSSLLSPSHSSLSSDSNLIIQTSSGQVMMSNNKTPELAFLEKHLFTHAMEKYDGQCRAVAVYSAPTCYIECEYATNKVWELVRAGYRWRDIGVMARDWEEYGPICENVFEKYAIPFFSSWKTDILDKPPVALIDAALDIASSGWEYKPVFRYLKTGIADISPEACAELENYIIKWNIRGNMWKRDWTLPTTGYESRSDDDENSDKEAVARLNSLRKLITEPITRLRDGIRGVTEAGVKLRALYVFFEDINLPERLAEKAEELEKHGEARLAREYGQVWNIVNNAMEQMFEILGTTNLDAVEFRKLFMLALSRYDVGVIPVSIDRTALGGMAMSRRRDLKCLIVLGATDDNMPKLAKGSGALSENERMELKRLGADIPAGLEDRLYREMNMLYSTITLPSRELVVTYPNGGGVRPSFIVKRIKSMFGTDEITFREEDYMSAAPTPCFELAALSENLENSPMAAAAREYFSEKAGGRFLCFSEQSRGTVPLLNSNTAISLYGSMLSLSASRVDKYYSCPFQHFAQSGLKLATREPAQLDAPTAGIFIHYILEGVAREITQTIGYENADEALCNELTTHYIKQFENDVLFNFEGKNARFVHMFHSIADDGMRIAQDMIEELKRSDFEALDFELDLEHNGDGSLVFSKQGENSSALQRKADEPLLQVGLSLRGMVDRVDGYRHGNKLYVRVMDYKTGKKALNLSDIMQGRDMQMLIYLFALQKDGLQKYGCEIAPAGALYVPARDVILKAPRNASEDQLNEMREKELKRSGIILNDISIVDAMEKGGKKKFLPVKYSKGGEITGDSLVTAQQLEMLSKHVNSMLRRAAAEILSGNIKRSPYYKNPNDNACLYCKYGAVCAFDENVGDKYRFIPKMKTEDVWSALGGEKI